MNRASLEKRIEALEQRQQAGHEPVVVVRWVVDADGSAEPLPPKGAVSPKTEACTGWQTELWSTARISSSSL